jgi:hypothetical protein
MVCRWDVRAYDIGLLMAGLDLMGFDYKFESPPRLYVKALVLKEVCKASLRYAESLSQTHLGVRIPKSTLHYWEIRHGEIDYDYSVVDSDWLKALHELFIDVRVRWSSLK